MKSEQREMGTASLSLRSPNLTETTAEEVDGCRAQLGSLDSGCIEKLLLHCATCLERNDVTLAQQVMWVLNNAASATGDPNQRLTSWLLRALVSRAARVCPPAASVKSNNPNAAVPRRLMSVIELAGYVDLIPWHRFGYCASNRAIFDAVRGCARVHVLDFSITHCMQWPTLIDALAKRPEGPPLLRITVPGFRQQVPPLLDASCEEVGLRLANFSALRQAPFEFSIIPNNPSSSATRDELEYLLSQLNPCSLNLRDDEVLVVNFQHWLRYLPDEPINDTRYSSSSSSSSLRDEFLSKVKSLNPRIVLAVDEDSNLSSPSLASRIVTCFNYLWIPFDALEAFLARDSRQRSEYESDVGHRIENLVGFEGQRRIERSESGPELSRRMMAGGFASVGFGEETAEEVKGLLDEHASGWGVKREEDMLVLTWKGHNSVFATAWVPC